MAILVPSSNGADISLPFAVVLQQGQEKATASEVVTKTKRDTSPKSRARQLHRIYIVFDNKIYIAMKCPLSFHSLKRPFLFYYRYNLMQQFFINESIKQQQGLHTLMQIWNKINCIMF